MILEQKVLLHWRLARLARPRLTIQAGCNVLRQGISCLGVCSECSHLHQELIAFFDDLCTRCGDYFSSWRKQGMFSSDGRIAMLGRKTEAR